MKKSNLTTICKSCGELIETTPSKLKKGKDKFCSKTCVNRGKSLIKECEICKKQFKVWLSQDWVRTCSRKCGYIIRKSFYGDDNVSRRPEVRKKISQKLKGRKITWEISGRFKPGAGHIYWKGGISDQRFIRLGHGLWRGIAKQVRDRDEHKCFDCSIEEKNMNIKLSVHHIVPYRLSKDDSINNLVSLCSRCHRLREVRLLSMV